MSAKRQSQCVRFLMVAVLLATSKITMATVVEENPITLSVDGIWLTIAISACRESLCEAVKFPEDMLNAMQEGYDEVSLEDLTLDLLPEVILTHSAEGAVNSCSRIYRYESKARALSLVDGLQGQICNYSVRDDALVSRYRNEAKWYEDIYEVRGNEFSLAFSDSCVGCGYISRAIYSNGKKIDGLLVTDEVDYRLRIPISTVIIGEEVTLYGGPSVDRKTGMYLISGDQVTLVDESLGEAAFWYKVRYKSMGGGAIDAWLQCEDVQFCEK